MEYQVGKGSRKSLDETHKLKRLKKAVNIAARSTYHKNQILGNSKDYKDDKKALDDFVKKCNETKDFDSLEKLFEQQKDIYNKLKSEVAEIASSGDKTLFAGEITSRLSQILSPLPLNIGGAIHGGIRSFFKKISQDHMGHEDFKENPEEKEGSIFYKGGKKNTPVPAEIVLPEPKSPPAASAPEGEHASSPKPVSASAPLLPQGNMAGIFPFNEGSFSGLKLTNEINLDNVRKGETTISDWLLGTAFVLDRRSLDEKLDFLKDQLEQHHSDSPLCSDGSVTLKSIESVIEKWDNNVHPDIAIMLLALQAKLSNKAEQQHIISYAKKYCQVARLGDALTSGLAPPEHKLEEEAHIPFIIRKGEILRETRKTKTEYTHYISVSLTQDQHNRTAALRIQDPLDKNDRVFTLSPDKVKEAIEVIAHFNVSSSEQTGHDDLTEAEKSEFNDKTLVDLLCRKKILAKNIETDSEERSFTQTKALCGLFSQKCGVHTEKHIKTKENKKSLWSIVRNGLRALRGFGGGKESPT